MPIWKGPICVRKNLGNPMSQEMNDSFDEISNNVLKEEEFGIYLKDCVQKRMRELKTLRSGLSDHWGEMASLQELGRIVSEIKEEREEEVEWEKRFRKQERVNAILLRLQTADECSNKMARHNPQLANATDIVQAEYFESIFTAFENRRKLLERRRVKLQSELVLDLLPISSQPKRKRDKISRVLQQIINIPENVNISQLKDEQVRGFVNRLQDNATKDSAQN